MPTRSAALRPDLPDPDLPDADLPDPGLTDPDLPGPAVPRTVAMPPGDTRRGVAAAMAAAVLFGTAGTAQALGPAGTTPMGVGAVRLLLGGLVLAALVQASGGWHRTGPRLVRRPVVLAAAACVASYQVAFFAGVERAGVAVGTLVAVGSAPVAAGLLAWPVLGRRPTPAWAAATAVGVAGVAVLSAGGGGAGDGAAGEGAAGAMGVLLALVAGASIAGFSVLAARAMASGEPRLPFLAASFLVAAGALVPLAVTQPLGWLLEPSGVLLALHLGVVTMAVANVAYARGLAALGPGPTSTLLLTEPVVALGLAVVVLAEPLGLSALLGAGLVVGALCVQGTAAGRSFSAGEPTTRRLRIALALTSRGGGPHSASGVARGAE